MSTTTTLKPRPVGQILIERGLLTQADLERALAEQKKGGHRKLLGEAIIDLGICSEDQVVEALAAGYDMPYAKLSSRLLDPRVIGELPRDFVEKQGVLPLFKVDGVLTIAISEPSNVFLLEEAGRLAGCVVQPVAASTADITKTMQAALPSANVFVIDDILDDASDVAQPDEAPLDIASLEADADGSPVIKLANYIISNAVHEGASDIHIEPDESQLRVRYRIDGRLLEKLKPPLQIGPALVSRIKIMASLDISERRLPQDGAIHVKMEGRPIDLRVSTLPNKFGEKVVLRIIDNQNVLVSLEQLGFDADTLEKFRHAIHLPHGLVLVTGPTGSGKSTTLYSGLSELNTPDVNICTVEDPIEFNLVGINQFQVNDKIGFSFPATLRSLLRQDPDVIMIGEIRDADTARIAVQAALTGHMVFSTLHTNDSAGAVTRLHNLGIEPYLISASLEGVLGQRLVRKLCASCAEETAPAPNVISMTERLGQKLDRVFTGAGCSKCRRTGFAGRLGIYELLLPDDELRDAITAGAGLGQLRQLARRSGMHTLLEDGFAKVREGRTTVEEVLSVTAA
jgi:type IV pilus assembly protein PilB